MVPNDFDIHLKELYERSVGQLLTDHFSLTAFEALYAHLCEKAELLKSEYVVSKQILQYIVSARNIINSRAKFVPAAQQNIHLVEKFSMLLELIAIGEDCNDRKPGVPRVI